MPDFDNGHIFLTTLAPIKKGAPDGASYQSHEQHVRTGLALMPVAKQSPATVNSDYISPFARNTRNHLARMFVLNNAVYNGRITKNPIISIAKSLLQRLPVIGGLFGNDNPADVAKPQTVDSLNAPYLVFCADIDAITDDGDPLPANLTAEQQRDVRASYARKLWDTMSTELTILYSNCYGFEGVNSADKFAAYLDRCHVETTMPFHDYYFQAPDFKNAGLIIPLGLAAIVSALVGFIALIASTVGISQFTLPNWLGGPMLIHTPLLWLGGFALGGLLGWITVTYINKRGQKPFPLGKYDDLPSVLKALYIQQKAADFFIDNQGADPQSLYDAFGKFIEDNDPRNRHSKTQKPGVISSTDPNNVTS